MDYEQKYKEALGWMRKLYPSFKDWVKEDAEHYFPELKESEDEKVRKALIELVKYAKGNCLELLHKPFNVVSMDAMLAWLEKQGEQKTDKIEPKFNVGDWVVTNDGKVRLVVSVDNDGDGYTFDNGVYFNGSWCDTYHLWTIQDAKDGDVLVTSTGQPFIFSGKYDDIHYGNPIAYCGVNWENKFKIGNGTHWTNKNEVAPATKEQRVLLFAKMKEAGYEWDAEKKELKKMEVASKESEDER